MLNLFSFGLSELKEIWRKMSTLGLRASIRNYIIKNIPARQDLSDIINQRVYGNDEKIRGIDRKLLILIWLSSDDGNTDTFTNSLNILSDKKNNNTLINNYCIKPEDALENHIITLNDTILLEYGFPPLDARNPFDWIIMNTLYYAHILLGGEDGTETLVRMENLFRRL